MILQLNFQFLPIKSRVVEKEKLYWLVCCSVAEKFKVCCVVSGWAAERTTWPEVEQDAENPSTITSELVQSDVVKLAVVALPPDGVMDNW